MMTIFQDYNSESKSKAFVYASGVIERETPGWVEMTHPDGRCY
jgi:hypothetical protein